MANTTSADWDETSPALADPRRQGAAEILALRLGVNSRISKEHEELDAAEVGGEHLAGSAKTYHQATAPTLRPDGTTALDADDAGRLWLDTDDGRLFRWTGSAWAVVVPNGLSNFNKVISVSTGVDTTFPQTQTTLQAGTWVVWVVGTLTDGTSAPYTVSLTMNSVTQTLYIDNHPDGTAPFMMCFAITVTGAGTASITAGSNVHHVCTMTGVRTGT